MNFLNNKKKLISELEIHAEVSKDVDLTNYNTFKIASTCEILVMPNNKESLKKVIDILKKHKKDFVVLGNGSNIILKNKKIKKVIILLNKLKKIEITNTTVYSEAGVLLSFLAQEALSKSLVGLDWAIGIPGTVGGSVYGNAGCYGEEISNRILNVEVLKDNEIITLNKNELYFSYRDSIFKKEKNMIILSVTFNLEYGDKETVMELIKERGLKRKESQPLEYPSAGSVFRNPEGNYAGAIIEQMGFKGYKVGGAQVSEKHANFIVNIDNATGEDVIKLIEEIKKKAKKEYNVELILEHIIID